MKIGIIVHSNTGNTYSVAEKLKEKLSAAGHSVTLQRVTAFNDQQQDVNKIQLKDIPDISTYDALIFGAPVRGFSLSAVMKAYLANAKYLKNKKTACFVTEGFPFPWMGGNRAVSQMKDACNSKGCEVCGTGVINWSNKKRNNMIAETVDKFCCLF